MDVEQEAIDRALAREAAASAEKAYQMMFEEIYREHQTEIDQEVEERMLDDDEIIERRGEIRDEVIEEWFDAEVDVDL
jgi:hypothetical protein